MGSAPEYGWYAQGHWRKLILPFQQIDLWLEIEVYPLLPPLCTEILSGNCLCGSCVHCHGLREFVYLGPRKQFPWSLSWLSQSFCLLFCIDAESLEVSHSAYYRVGSLGVNHCLQQENFLWWGLGESLVYGHNMMPLGVALPLCSFSRTTTIGFPLGPWLNLSQLLDSLSIKCEFHLMKSAWNTITKGLLVHDICAIICTGGCILQAITTVAQSSE